MVLAACARLGKSAKPAQATREITLSLGITGTSLGKERSRGRAVSNSLRCLLTIGRSQEELSLWVHKLGGSIVG